jgi:hypothetical protein
MSRNACCLIGYILFELKNDKSLNPLDSIAGETISAKEEIITIWSDTWFAKMHTQ